MREALLTAGRVRLRPILMTAFATILALIPLALGLTEGAIIAAELATVVIGGLLTSTLLTLLVVPVVYSLFDSAGRWFGRRWGRGDGQTEIGLNGHGDPRGEGLRPADEPTPVATR